MVFKSQEYENYIDYRDIYDVKLMIVQTMDSEEIFPEDQTTHDFHLQLTLTTVNGVCY
jgi:hypothetical protein